MIRAQVLTWWVEQTQGGITAYVPHVATAYTLQRCGDITYQAGNAIPTDPNAVLVEIECDSATLAALQADPEYDGAVEVLE